MRRLNIKLSLWLVGITIFSVVGVHFLHGFQIERNADFLKRQAERSSKDGNAKEAIKQYVQFLKYRDDSESYEELAKLVVENAKDASATRQDKVKAYNILEEAIRRHPELHSVRKRLVDYTMGMRHFSESLEHIQYLIDNGQQDTELEVKLAGCYFATGDEDKALKKLYELVGYDPTTEQFSEQQPPGAKEIGAYEVLGQILRRKTDGANRAADVMAQLVKWNPESPQAHLQRAAFLLGLAESRAASTRTKPEESEEFKQAKAELDEALRLAPDDVDAIISLGVYAIWERDFAKSQELLDKALKLDPKREEVYLRLAQLSLTQNDPQKAVAQLTEGAEKATNVNQILERLVDLHFQLNNIDAVKKVCRQMRERETFSSDLIRYEEARVKFAENNYLEAAREFEAVRPVLERMTGGTYVQQLDLLLARCYELLNQPDRQLEVYRRVLARTPNHVAAIVGQASALQALGRHAEASESLKLLVANARQVPFIHGSLLYLLINEELRKPEADRDWSDVESIAGLLYENKQRSELDNTLLKAELLMMQKKPAEAQALLLAAQKEHPKDSRIWMTLTKLLNNDDKRRDRVAQLLDRAEKEIGDSAALRSERIKLIAQRKGDGAAAELKKLEVGIDQFSEPERLTLQLALGNAYLQLRDFENAKRLWKIVAEKDLKNSNLRQYLFELAIDSKDEAMVRGVIKEIHDSPNFGPNSALYKYCAASNIIWEVNRRNQERKGGGLTAEDQKALAEARKLVDEGIAARGEWGALWRVRGEIDHLEENIPGAIENYQRSLEFSRTGQAATARRLVHLLYLANRLEEAKEALKYMGEQDSSDAFTRKLVGDIEQKTGDIDKALAMAEKDIQADPKNAMNYVWLAQLLVRAGRVEEAEAQFRQAAKINPNLPEVWDLLVRHLMAIKKKNDAVDAVREASTALAEKPLALARLYERIEDNAQAEQYFQKAIEANPDDLIAKRQFVEHLVGTGQVAKATPLLDKVIEQSQKSTEAAQQPHFAWARRTKAQLLASGGNYEQVMEATKLIEQNAVNGKLNGDDAAAIVNLLSARPEPESRARAAHLLTKMQDARPLMPREQAVLGGLLERSGNWPQARELMLAALSRRSDDPEMLVNFVNLLIKHEEYEDASRWMERLNELIKPPARVSEALKQAAAEERARLLIHDGQKEQAVAVLEGLAPSPLPQNQLFRLELVARLMETLGLNDAAERLLNDYMNQEKRGTIALAAFLGRAGNIDRAFALLEEARKNQPATEVLPVAMEGLRRHPDKISKERFDIVEGWAKQALESEANSVQIKLLLAEIYDLQGRYPEVISIYRDVLADKKADAFQKALVKNNLAFVLALSKDSPDSGAESLKLAQEAVQMIGPTSDLLDTRALAYLADGKTKEAIADLDIAIADSPSASKYLHKALAEKTAGNAEKAKEALTKAQESPDEVRRFTPLEQQTLSKLNAQLP